MMNKSNYEIVIALGTNENQETNMRTAKQLLRQLFSDIEFTKSIWTKPIGMQSERFLNCLAIAHTKHREPQISSALKRIEIRCGNTRALRTVNIVRMDIDILLFDHQRLHEKDWKRSYIKNLMKEIDSIRERAEQAKVSSSNQQQ